MIKKLKIRFVALNIMIVFVMLIIIFITILGVTQKNLRNNNIDFMKDIITNPFRTLALGENNLQQPFFIIDSSEKGEVLIAQSGYYDISNNIIIKELLDSVQKNEIGEIEKYNLIYYSEKIKAIQRYVFVDISSEIKIIEGLILNLLIIGGASVAVFLIISIILSYWVAKPVKAAWEQQKIFVSDASHELKTPLTIITTNAELIDEDSKKIESLVENIADIKVTEKRLEHIMESAEKMKGLINDLLTLAKTESHNQETNKEMINLSESVNMEALTFEALYFEKGLKLEIDIEEYLSIKGNSTQINQLVTIFLDNAYKYTVENGRAHITLKRLNNKYCMLAVSNEGHQIVKEDLQKIFNRFYRLDSSRGKQEGYGLGLAIAKVIAKQHKGKIWAESEVGKNTFFVKFKLQENNAFS